MQWAEDHLLRADAGEAPEARKFPRAGGIAAGFTAPSWRRSEALRAPVYEPGREVFHQGAPGNEMFVIVKGPPARSFARPAEARSAGDFRAGTAFGELAILDPACVPRA